MFIAIIHHHSELQYSHLFIAIIYHYSQLFIAIIYHYSQLVTFYHHYYCIYHYSPFIITIVSEYSPLFIYHSPWFPFSSLITALSIPSSTARFGCWLKACCRRSPVCRSEWLDGLTSRMGLCKWIFKWIKNMSGWWFGTFGLVFHMLGRIFPTDFHIVQRGWNHQPGEPCSFFCELAM